MKLLDYSLTKLISDRCIFVLRRRRDNVALNVSYSEDGLKMTTNKVGKLLYYKKAFLTSGKKVGDLSPANDVYVEKFEPRNHASAAAQIAEYTWVKKATHLLYGVSVVH